MDAMENKPSPIPPQVSSKTKHEHSTLCTRTFCLFTIRISNAFGLGGGYRYRIFISTFYPISMHVGTFAANTGIQTHTCMYFTCCRHTGNCICAFSLEFSMLNFLFHQLIFVIRRDRSRLSASLLLCSQFRQSEIQAFVVCSFDDTCCLLAIFVRVLISYLNCRLIQQKSKVSINLVDCVCILSDDLSLCVNLFE